ncbi:MAG: xanthine dehydrogenase family protein molybdopterin-binding subunit [Chloroflexi bacterium]|nr:MAG: xanthine dehydrogenase family protein molybdopterin-binding subunit [Chloroflexota bacterium]
MALAEQTKIPNPIGESMPRIDVFEKVTGAAVYTDDIQFGPQLLYARVKRSPHPHALIKKIDVSKARALPGVKVVVTGDDFPGHIGLYLKDKHIFARDRVRFVGEPVAAVAAISEEIAEKALDLIEVEYEPLEPVLDPVYGASPEAPLVHPDLGEYEVVNFIFPKPGTNISNHFKIRKGDVEAAWPKCAAIVERTYHIPHVQHVPIEPHVAVAKVDETGEVTLWASSQSPFAQRNLIAKTLGISQSDMRVIAPYVGGGFGCKAGVTMEAIPVAIAQKAKGRPVKLRLTREEEFYTNFVRQGLVIKLKVGCDKDGNLLAMENTMYWDGGASTEYGVNITRAGGYSSTGPFDIPNVKTDSMCVYTNHPIGGAYRGFGMSELHAGIGQVMDELAEKIGMDKVEFLKRNVVQGGDILGTGMKMHPTGIKECIDKVAEALDWGKKAEPSAPNKLRGKGIAVMWKAPAMPPNAGSSAVIELNEDGTLTVNIGGQEIGQGTFTAMAQLAAGVMGVPMDWVRIAGPIDTQYSPYEWQTVASRLTWSMGNAVVAAARDARQQVLKVVAEAWDEDPDDLDIVNGTVVSYKSEREMSLKDIGIYGINKEGDTGWIGGPIVGRGNFMPTYVTGLDPETGQGNRAVVHYTTGAQGFEIEIDKDTGRLEIIRAASAFDVGKAINPDLVRAQIEGGFVQGMSSAIFEEMKLVGGEMKNPSFVDYRIATAADIPPEHKTFIVEVPQDDGPFGARGIGEHPMVPSIAALGNAIYDAISVRLDPPFTSEKIYLAMLDAGLVE